MKLFLKGLCVLVALSLVACATTKEPRKPPHCKGKYERINSIDVYPVVEGKR